MISELKRRAALLKTEIIEKEDELVAIGKEIQAVADDALKRFRVDNPGWEVGQQVNLPTRSGNSALAGTVVALSCTHNMSSPDNMYQVWAEVAYFIGDRSLKRVVLAANYTYI